MNKMIISLTLALASPCFAGPSKDLPPADRVLLEEAKIYLWFSRNVSERIQPRQVEWLVTQFIKQHSETREKLVKTYLDLYQPGPPLISSQANPTTVTVYTSAGQLMLLSLDQLRTVIAKRDNDQKKEALQTLTTWLETKARQFNDKEDVLR